jgi:hypothetical protein
MTYLSITKFWNYQNADVWSKSKGHPPWFKHYVHRDRELDLLDPMARLLYYELLGAATRNKNVLLSDPKWLFAETRVDEQEIAKHLPELLKGGWLKASERPIHSRKPSRKYRAKARDLIEEEEDIPLTPSQKGIESLQKESWNPRAAGTNPRAVARDERFRAGLEDLVRRTIDEYPEPSLLEELQSHGLTHDEALELVERVRGEREPSTAEVAV